MFVLAACKGSEGIVPQSYAQRCGYGCVAHSDLGHFMSGACTSSAKVGVLTIVTWISD